MTQPLPPPGSIGLGWRPPLASHLLREPAGVDFVEVVAESCFTQGSATREARALTASWPVVVHGIKASLGSGEGAAAPDLDRLAVLAHDVGAAAVTEHVAFVRGRDVALGHLTGLPRSREAVDVVVHNALQLRARLRVPLLLENVARSMDWPDDAMDEGTFHRLLCEATGCPLLLDVSNLYANARNEGRDPARALEAFPLERVAMVHLAGGHTEDGFYFDTHADPVPADIFALLEQVAERAGNVPVILERDANFGSVDELLDELHRARAALSRGSPREVHMLNATGTGAPSPALANRQLALARHLVAPGGANIHAPEGFVAEQLTRTRDILQRKRVEEALPLLPRLNARATDVNTLASHALASAPRAPRLVAVSDAWHIALAALADPRFAGDAEADALILRARFQRDSALDVPRPRWSPFIGRARGQRTWAIKGPGAGATVHTFHG